jgi:four helix bundle protein
MHYEDLNVYNLAYELAMDIFKVTKHFPEEEKYSLTSQIIRSSRSISSNITEGWARWQYENSFKRHLIYALGSSAKTENWLKFARDCGYIPEQNAEKNY